MYKNNYMGFSLWGVIIIILFIIIFQSCNICCNNEINNEGFMNITEMKDYIGEVYNINENKKKLNIYNFYAPWCPHSTNFLPIWNNFSEYINNNKSKYNFDINVQSIICDENMDMCTKYEIQGLPTVIYEYNGNKTKYNNARTVESLIKFIDENYIN